LKTNYMTITFNKFYPQFRNRNLRLNTIQIKNNRLDKYLTTFKNLNTTEY